MSPAALPGMSLEGWARKGVGSGRTLIMQRSVADMGAARRCQHASIRCFYEMRTNRRAVARVAIM